MASPDSDRRPTACSGRRCAPPLMLSGQGKEKPFRVLLIRREFEVSVGAERAWRHLSKVAAWPSWAHHIRSIEVKPTGELGLGSRGHIRLRNGVRSTFEVVEFNPHSNWTWVGPFLWLNVRYDHQFLSLGGERTRPTWVVEADGVGVSILGRLFAAIYRGSMERAIPLLVEEMSNGGRDA